MRPSFTLIAFFLLLAVALSCKKSKTITGCFPDAATVRQISNKQAVIQLTATINPVFIIEQGSIDTKLVPCNFPMEFYQDGLQVIISGDVKYSSQTPSAPCCIESFVITKITK